MKIFYISDLHLEMECNAIAWDVLMHELRNKSYDVVVIAGDLNYLSNGLEKNLRVIKKSITTPLIFVPGNHDYWNTPWNQGVQQFITLRDTLPSEGIHVLFDSFVDIEGKRFIGNTLWTDYMLRGPGHEYIDMTAGQRYMVDFAKIAGFTPVKAQIEHNITRLFILSNLLPAPRSNIIVTHHVPLFTSEIAHPKYPLNETTASFHSHIDNFVNDDVAAIIYGHNHWSAQTEYAGVHVVSAQFGYDNGEQSNFRGAGILNV